MFSSMASPTPGMWLMMLRSIDKQASADSKSSKRAPVGAETEAERDGILVELNVPQFQKGATGKMLRIKDIEPKAYGYAIWGKTVDEEFAWGLLYQQNPRDIALVDTFIKQAKEFGITNAEIYFTAPHPFNPKNLGKSPDQRRVQVAGLKNILASGLTPPATGAPSDLHTNLRWEEDELKFFQVDKFGGGLIEKVSETGREQEDVSRYLDLTPST